MPEMQIDKSELERLIDRLDNAPNVLQAAKREAFSAAAPKLKQALDSQLGGSGKVRSWQGQFVGSKGGYAAVRPKKEAYVETRGKQTGFRAGPKKYAVGYVTNAVNSGHKWPRNTWGYRTRAGTVPGRQFYRRAQAQAESVAREAGEQIVRTLMDHLGG